MGKEGPAPVPRHWNYIMGVLHPCQAGVSERSIPLTGGQDGAGTQGGSQAWFWRNSRGGNKTKQEA